MPVVPLILAELEHEPDQWFWALEAITDEDPVPLRGERKGCLDGTSMDRLGKQHGHVVR